MATAVHPVLPVDKEEGSFGALNSNFLNFDGDADPIFLAEEPQSFLHSSILDHMDEAEDTYQEQPLVYLQPGAEPSELHLTTPLISGDGDIFKLHELSSGAPESPNSSLSGSPSPETRDDATELSDGYRPVAMSSYGALHTRGVSNGSSTVGFDSSPSSSGSGSGSGSEVGSEMDCEDTKTAPRPKGKGVKRKPRTSANGRKNPARDLMTELLGESKDIAQEHAHLPQRERNKMSAQRYRKRLRLYRTALEKRVGELEEESEDKDATITELQNENTALQKQLDFMRNLLMNSGQAIAGLVMPSADSTSIKIEDQERPAKRHKSASAAVASGAVVFALFSVFLLCSPMLSPQQEAHKTLASYAGGSNTESHDVEPYLRRVGNGRVLLSISEDCGCITSCGMDEPAHAPQTAVSSNLDTTINATFSSIHEDVSLPPSSIFQTVAVSA